MRDIDNDMDSDQQAPFLELRNGLDPACNYTQKFHYYSEKNVPKIPPKAEFGRSKAE